MYLWQVSVALLRSLTRMVNVSNLYTCISLNNHLWIIRPTLTDLSPDDYNQALHYFPFTVYLDRCNGICTSFDEQTGKICVPNIAHVVNINVVSMITRINESKACRCEFAVRSESTKTVLINFGNKKQPVN